jgi:hypothetical protein
LTKAAILLTILFEKPEFDEESWQILLKFAEDSCLPIRLRILKAFQADEFRECSTEVLSGKLDMARQSTKCRLEELEAAHVLRAHYAKQYENSSFETIVGWTVRDEIKTLMNRIYHPDQLMLVKST